MAVLLMACLAAGSGHGASLMHTSRHGMQLVFKACKRLFAALPLAACIAGNTLVLHGGGQAA